MRELRSLKRVEKANSLLAKGMMGLSEKNKPEKRPLAEPYTENERSLLKKRFKFFEIKKKQVGGDEEVFVIPGLEHLRVTKVNPAVEIIAPKKFTYRKDLASATTAVSYEPYRYANFNSTPLIQHFKADPYFKTMVGKNEQVALTQGFAALMTDLKGNVLMSFAMFEDGLTLRTRITSVFNAQMFYLPERYLARKKQNNELFASRK